MELQRQALAAAGCHVVLEDQITGVARRRPGLDKVLARLEAGDVLVVWRLDRLGRSLSHLIEVIGELGARKIGFRSLSESIDTTTAGGRLIFHIMGSLAEFERALIGERTRAGMAAARSRGVKVGRRKVMTARKITRALRLISEGVKVADVAKRLKVGKSTLYRNLRP